METPGEHTSVEIDGSTPQEVDLLDLYLLVRDIGLALTDRLDSINAHLGEIERELATIRGFV